MENNVKNQKYTYYTILQGLYSLEYGWEDLSEAVTKDKKQMKELLSLMSEYRRNDRNWGSKHRFITRRVLNDKSHK